MSSALIETPIGISGVLADRSQEIDTKCGGFKNIGGGEGGFLIRAAGGGTVVAFCYGAIDTVELGSANSVLTRPDGRR